MVLILILIIQFGLGILDGVNVQAVYPQRVQSLKSASVEFLSQALVVTRHSYTKPKEWPLIKKGISGLQVLKTIES